jgi:hypothetical protein
MKKKISVIMVDGGFREHIYGAEYFSQQNFPKEDYEVIWIEHYSQPHKDLKNYPELRVFTLDRMEEYHSSYCFNKGISLAKGTVLVIVDADQVVQSDFLSKIWEIHSRYHALVNYVYRYDEEEKGSIKTINFAELEKKCVLKNPHNYGACLTVKKEWLLKINGYEMHPIFKSGFHANGLDIYTRLKNLGLAVQWAKDLKLYHPWHPLTLHYPKQYKNQLRLIQWRTMNRHFMAIKGIDSSLNYKPTKYVQELLNSNFKTSLKMRVDRVLDRVKKLC